MGVKVKEQNVETVAVKVDGRSIEVPRTTPNWEGKPEPTTVLQACKKFNQHLLTCSSNSWQTEGCYQMGIQI